MPKPITHRARCLAVLAMLALPALAAVNPSQAAPAAQVAQGGPGDVNAADMENFVTAAKAIVALRQRYEPRMQAAGSEAAIRALVEEARGLMRTAITDTGMSVENYMAIAQAAQANPELRKRIEDAVGVPGQ